MARTKNLHHGSLHEAMSVRGRAHVARVQSIVPCAIVGIGLAVLVGLGCQTESARYAELAKDSSVVAPGTLGDRLFQAHCGACHGRIGDGKGIATIALSVAPRDFWNEPFRYVSTLDGIPTKQDLIQTIRSGRLHGEMPSAPWLSETDAEVLAEYVLELNRLGWRERLAAEFTDEGMTSVELEEISHERVSTMEPVTVAMPDAAFVYDEQRAEELYVQSCASCHGPSGRGDGLDMPLDELGRPISVRDLVTEPIHGGSDPIELFKRIRCGVPGTPMPAQAALTDNQVWQLVYYTRFLMGQPLD